MSIDIDLNKKTDETYKIRKATTTKTSIPKLQTNKNFKQRRMKIATVQNI